MEQRKCDCGCGRDFRETRVMSKEECRAAIQEALLAVTQVAVSQGIGSVVLGAACGLFHELPADWREGNTSAKDPQVRAKFTEMLDRATESIYGEARITLGPGEEVPAHERVVH